jgi:hypothetical protein
MHACNAACQTFDHARVQDAAIVILMLGNTDDLAAIAPEESIANVQRVSEALVARGKRVYIQSVNTWTEYQAAESDPRNAVERNRLLEAYLQVGPPVAATGSRMAIRDPVAGVCMDAVGNFEWRLPALFTSDGYLSPRGYTKLARDYAELLEGPLVQVEFARFRDKMGL